MVEPLGSGWLAPPVAGIVEVPGAVGLGAGFGLPIDCAPAAVAMPTERARAARAIRSVFVMGPESPESGLLKPAALTNEEVSVPPAKPVR
jgi:hypothetical protein